MQINIRLGSEIILEKTLERARAKLSKLARMVDEKTSESVAHMDITRESGAQHSEQLWRVSIEIFIAGEIYLASVTAETAEHAIDEAIAEVKRNLIRARSKQQTMIKRGGALFKRLTQRF